MCVTQRLSVMSIIDCCGSTGKGGGVTIIVDVFFNGRDVGEYQCLLTQVGRNIQQFELPIAVEKNI